MQQQTLKIAGHRLAAICSTEGSLGPPVVFIPGITASVDFWPPVLPPAVRNERPWVSLSLPGHFPSQGPPGFTSAQVTAEELAGLHSAAIEQLVGNQKIALVGWSTGGFSALNLAARHPEQVGSVFSISGFSNGCWTGVIRQVQRLLRTGRLGRRLFDSIWTVLGRRRRLFEFAMSRAAANRRAFRESPLTPQVLSDWRGAIQGHDREVLAALFDRLAELDIDRDLSRIAVPTLIAGGDRDPFIPASHTKHLAQQVPGAKLHLFSGVGHMFFAEATEEFQHLLTDWLARCDEREPAPAARPVACCH
ncbi:MAG: alpha/beta fold hydrolase [Planctomycetaceae bacterium]